MNQNNWLLVITSDHGVAVSSHASSEDAKMYLAFCIMDWLPDDRTVGTLGAQRIVELGLGGQHDDVVCKYFAETSECQYKLFQLSYVQAPHAHTAEDLTGVALMAKCVLMSDGWWT